MACHCVQFWLFPLIQISIYVIYSEHVQIILSLTIIASFWPCYKDADRGISVSQSESILNVCNSEHAQIYDHLWVNMDIL